MISRCSGKYLGELSLCWDCTRTGRVSSGDSRSGKTYEECARTNSRTRDVIN